MKPVIIAIALLITTVYSGSCDRNTAAVQKKRQQGIVKNKVSAMLKPEQNSRFTIGDSIEVNATLPDSLAPDSVEVYFKGKLYGSYSGNGDIIITTDGANPGKAGVRIKLFFADSISESHSRQVELLSDVVPKQYHYRVINSYPHDVGAYTQGLVYHEGWLYEGTGNYNQSTLRKVRLEDGEIIQIRNNASDIFGEGITIYNKQIYQLTYKAQICFVYDLHTFEEIRKYYFQNKEGWGITNSETELIMSDGTHMLYFIDPNTDTVIRQIEVFNDQGPVEDLNELEYINGKIYANRYYTDEIVIIDPENGKEVGRVNMKGILPLKDRKPGTNVLNGVAWDQEGERLFVTGKYWPRLFEIELVPAD
ncbi:MAG: glutaminyl-peptide cyclotransferase [Bacteroidales bacterium]|nr:glutaminyl-peptide cyclotransferase [Bacteroidales bacterium]